MGVSGGISYLDGIRRVLVVSDLHGHRPHLDWLRINARDYDLVVVPGDFDDVSIDMPPDARAAITSGFVSEIAASTPIAVCSGNHDLDALNDAGERVSTWARSLGVNAYGDGEIVICGDYAISLLPWWDGPVGAAAMRDQVADHAAVSAGRSWIWVHHAPVAGSATSWDGTRQQGDEVLAELVDEHQPSAVLSGHIHDAPFLDGGDWADRRGDTLLLNGGRQMTSTPSHVELDLTSGMAVWHAEIAGAGRTEAVAIAEPRLSAAA